MLFYNALFKRERAQEPDVFGNKISFVRVEPTLDVGFLKQVSELCNSVFCKLKLSLFLGNLFGVDGIGVHHHQHLWFPVWRCSPVERFALKLVAAFFANRWNRCCPDGAIDRALHLALDGALYRASLSRAELRVRFCLLRSQVCNGLRVGEAPRPRLRLPRGVQVFGAIQRAALGERVGAHDDAVHHHGRHGIARLLERRAVVYHHARQLLGICRKLSLRCNILHLQVNVTLDGVVDNLDARVVLPALERRAPRAQQSRDAQLNLLARRSVLPHTRWVDAHLGHLARQAFR